MATLKGDIIAFPLRIVQLPTILVYEHTDMQLSFPSAPQVFVTFFDRATERAMRSSLKMVVNSMFLLIQSLFMMTESVMAPR